MTSSEMIVPMAETLVEREKYPTDSRVPRVGVTKAGVSVNADTALQLSTCWACVRFLSQSVAWLPWDLRRRTARGSEVQEYNPTHWILHDRASSEYSSMQFRETMMRWAVMGGNAYAEVEWREDGRPYALWPIHPTRVRVMRRVDDGELIYEVDGGRVYLAAEDVFHLRGPGEGPVGLSVVTYAAQSIGWARAAQIFGASFFRQSANPSGIVTMKRTLSPEGMAELRTDFLRLYGGAAGANKVVFLDADMTYQAVSVEPEKGQFVETNQLLITEICRWFGVPPHKVADLSNATFSNIEHQSIEVVMDSLRPWVKRFEDEADAKLLGQNRRGLYSQIDMKPLLRADADSRMKLYTGLRNIGALNSNEIRELEGMNGIGPDGEKYTMQAGMTTLNKIGADPEPAVPEQSPQVIPQEPGRPEAVEQLVTIGMIKERIRAECPEPVSAEA